MAAAGLLQVGGLSFWHPPTTRRMADAPDQGAIQTARERRLRRPSLGISPMRWAFRLKKQDDTSDP
jgi:hypothetical protein